VSKQEPDSLNPPNVADFLENSEYRLFAESIPNLAWIAHADGSIFWYNRRWFEYTGTTPEDMEGWGWQSVHDPTVLPQVLARWRESIRNAEPFEMTFPIRGSDGILRPFLTRVIPIKDEQNTVLRWFGTNTDVSEQIRTTNALRESEERFRIATKAVNGILWTNDANGEMQGEQPGWSAFTGQSHDEYRGYGWSKVVHPDDAQPTIEAWKESVRERRLFAFEHRVRRHDGQYRLCSVRALPVIDELGNIREWVGIHTDITDDRKTQQALHDADERLRLAMTAANGIGTWDWDVQSDLIYANEGFAHMFGVDPARAASGLSLGEFSRNIHPDDKVRVSEAIESAVQSGNEYRCEYRLVQPDNSHRWISAVGKCNLDAARAPLRFPGVAVDITEMRRSDDALRKSEQSLRIAASTARLGTWELDLTTGLMNCSDICKSNFGRPVELPFNYPDLIATIHPEDRSTMQAAVQQAIDNRSDYSLEYRILFPDASLHWVRASGHTADDENGKPTRMVGVTLDVTERYRTQAALLQTEKLAAVGRLAASIAHEINNPLEAITNLLYLALKSDNPADIHWMLETADEQLRRVSIIANQTLRFHKQSSNPREISCLDLFSTVISMYEGKLRNSGINVEKRKRAERLVKVYEGDIRQVLNNILGNAIDAMPAGGRLLLRSRESRDWKNGELGIVLTVADTGTGIAHETRQKIFDAFFTTKGFGGTGLGLWVSAEIMNRHHGRISVRSSTHPAHHGTVMSLFLPFQSKLPPSTSDLSAQ
jgi:PAS domain S-box-containing protein